MGNPEETLIEQAQAGDKNALAQLVSAHFQPVYRVALRMCGNVSDAEETMQETFLSAIKALPRFEGRSQFSTWLYRIASNACFMRQRRQAAEPEMIGIEGEYREREYEVNEHREPFAAPRLLSDWSAQPMEATLDQELRDTLQAAIAQLPPTLRIVLIWRDLEGLSTAETAEILAISEAAVKVRLHRARLQLRESLAGYFVAQASTPLQR